MLTKDEQKTADAQKTGVQNTNLDDVLLGKRVKIARKEKQLTQEELADLCDCTPTHICNIENGKIGISLDLLFKISILLEKSMDYCINRREFAICTEKTCHSIGDFPPPRRPPSTKKLCRQSHRQSSEILIFYFGYWNIVLL